MKSIRKAVRFEAEIKKSKFITHLVPVAFPKDVEHLLKSLRNQYPDAAHHCYAYILGEHGDVQKFNDDGEPSKTAGIPILEVLKKNDLTNVLCVVVRYFGGVKLGAGGLVRAYTNGASEAVKLSETTQQTAMVSVVIKTIFPHYDAVDRLIQKFGKVTDTFYKEDVTIHLDCEEANFNKLKEALINLTSGNAYIDITKVFTDYK